MKSTLFLFLEPSDQDLKVFVEIFRIIDASVVTNSLQEIVG